jgi:cytochrome c6
MWKNILFGFALLLSSSLLLVDAWHPPMMGSSSSPLGRRVKHSTVPITKQKSSTTTSSSSVAAIAMMAALFTTTVIPPPAFAADITQGQELFALNCAGCHAGGQNLVFPSKTLQAAALTQYLGGTDPATIQTFATTKHPKVIFFKMPDGKLTTEQYQDVTAYISDQATNEKW